MTSHAAIEQCAQVPHTTEALSALHVRCCIEGIQKSWSTRRPGSSALHLDALRSDRTVSRTRASK
jgi:hypothetical protein